MRAIVSALLVLASCLFVGNARADGPSVLVLQGGAALSGEHDRLVEALRIYTGDRDGVVLLEPGAPAQPTPAAVAETLARARARGAAIVAWTGRRADGGAVYYVLTAARGELRETEIAPLGAERTAVDVALKVRALLPATAGPAGTAGPAVSGSDGAAPTKAPPPEPTAPRAPPTAAVPPAPPPAAPPVPPPHGPPTPPSAAVRVVASPPPDEPPLPEPRFALAAGYGYFLPTDSTWRRGGLVLGAELRVARLGGAPLSIFVDAAIIERPSRRLRGFDVELGDTPVGAGALLRSSWGRWAAALGPRASLHILDIDAWSPPDRSGGARRYAAGLGGRFELDLRLFAYMKATVGASLEGLIPTREFTLAGQPVVSTGRVLAVFTGGLALLIP